MLDDVPDVIDTVDVTMKLTRSLVTVGVPLQIESLSAHVAKSENNGFFVASTFAVTFTVLKKVVPPPSELPQPEIQKTSTVENNRNLFMYVLPDDDLLFI